MDGGALRFHNQWPRAAYQREAQIVLELPLAVSFELLPLVFELPSLFHYSNTPIPSATPVNPASAIRVAIRLFSLSSSL